MYFVLQMQGYLRYLNHLASLKHEPNHQITHQHSCSTTCWRSGWILHRKWNRNMVQLSQQTIFQSTQLVVRPSLDDTIYNDGHFLLSHLGQTFYSPSESCSYHVCHSAFSQFLVEHHFFCTSSASIRTYRNRLHVDCHFPHHSRLLSYQQSSCMAPHSISNVGEFRINSERSHCLAELIPITFHCFWARPFGSRAWLQSTPQAAWSWLAAPVRANSSYIHPKKHHRQHIPINKTCGKTIIEHK